MSTGTRILFIEDELYIAELYAQVLQHSNYTVKIIADGAVGLQVAQKEPFDVILLDLMLPNMTGMEILRNLRDPAKTPGFQSKVIILTNLDEDDATKSEIQSMAQGYLIKAEITPKQLVQYLQQLP